MMNMTDVELRIIHVMCEASMFAHAIGQEHDLYDAQEAIKSLNEKVKQEQVRRGIR
jgi:hypothetical protein